MVQFQPLIISTKYRKYLVQAFRITKLMEIDHLTPRHQIRSGTHRIIALKAIGTICLYFTANETVGMLLGVKVVQRILERKETGTIAGKHQNERGIPHKDITIISCIQID